MYLRSGLLKALPGFFLCIFSSLTCLKKLVFSKRFYVIAMSIVFSKLHFQRLMYSSGKEHVSILQNELPSITMSSSKIDSLNRDITKIVPTKFNHERIGHEPNANEEIKFQRFDMRTKKKYLNKNVFETFVYYIFSL
jgi:hypothetical protein